VAIQELVSHAAGRVVTQTVLKTVYIAGAEVGVHDRKTPEVGALVDMAAFWLGGLINSSSITVCKVDRSISGDNRASDLLQVGNECGSRLAIMSEC
jgi:hypothetical protein